MSGSHSCKIMILQLLQLEYNNQQSNICLLITGPLFGSWKQTFSISTIIKWSNVLILNQIRNQKVAQSVSRRFQILNPILCLKCMHHKSCPSLHASIRSCFIAVCLGPSDSRRPAMFPASVRLTVRERAFRFKLQSPNDGVKVKLNLDGEFAPICFVTSTFDHLQCIKSSVIPIHMISYVAILKWSVLQIQIHVDFKFKCLVLLLKDINIGIRLMHTGVIITYRDNLLSLMSFPNHMIFLLSCNIQKI